MEIVLSLLSSGSKLFVAIGPFLLLLGVLIFIHELGHFLVARYFGVKVEVFSLGFGPKILKYKRGDTIYCISLLPLGGYVKMFGSHPLEEVPEEEKPKGFLYKKVHQKWLIAFAGPFFNLIFTLLAFFLLAKIGLPSLPAKLGDVLKSSPAYKMGFRSGDEILSVDGNKISYYKDLEKVLKDRFGEKLLIRARDETGQLKELKAFVQKVKNPHPLAKNKYIGSVEGFTVLSTGLSAGVRFESLAYKTGFRTFDEILEVNGKPLRYWRELEDFFLKEKPPYRVKIQRDNKEMFFSLDKKNSLLNLGLEPSFLYIGKVGADTPAGRAGLMTGDRLVSMDGKFLENWNQVLDYIKNSKGKALNLSYQRKGETKEILISPEQLFVEGNVKHRYMLGIVSGGLFKAPPELKHVKGFLSSCSYSVSETWKWLKLISRGLARLITGELSLRTMGGPIVIGRMAHSSFSTGFLSFLYMMALISINLFFINLLPIPVLDGGHLLFFTLEGILGRPLSVKKLVFAQNVGVVFILFFMGFTVFIDIYNWLKAW